MLDVIIPARNEEGTIGAVVQTFLDHPGIGHVIVVVDDATQDSTAAKAAVLDPHNELLVIRRGGIKGKGECVQLGLDFAGSYRIIFCDADIIGLTASHIDLLCKGGDNEIVYGVPDYPTDVPMRVTSAWAWITGIRTVPIWIMDAIRFDLHGYLMETQINQACAKAILPWRHERLNGLYTPFTWPLPDDRRDEMHRDYLWGLDHGVFGPPAQGKWTGYVYLATTRRQARRNAP
jgi:glycosyltransferase involved in cell wall biosynthesis